jgi:hypothetical protein
MDSLGPLRPSVLQQNFFVGKPQFTEKNLGDLTGKVTIPLFRLPACPPPPLQVTY